MQEVNLEKSFAAECSSSVLPSETEFQLVVNGARPRIWSPQASPTSVLQLSQSFDLLRNLDEGTTVILQAALRKDGKKGGASALHFQMIVLFLNVRGFDKPSKRKNLFSILR
ncbi:unnamed protein product [Linum trigynum]|uniref:Uncharacterized protein n=1 Tax=Linum trigynum TaxID=586398 RepID=A0AAV2FTR1_9ROSI